MPSQIRSYSKIKVLQQLRNHSSLSRSELADQLNISNAGVARLITGLEQMGLIRECQSQATGERGRPSLHIELEGSGAYGLGINLEATNFRFGLIDFRNRWVADTTLPNPLLIDRDPKSANIQKVAKDIQDWVDRTLTAQQRPRLLGAMLTASGVVSEKRDQFLRVSIGADATQINRLMEELGQRLNVPTGMINESDASLLSEGYMGQDMSPNQNLVLVSNRMGFSMMVRNQITNELIQSSRSLTDLHMQYDCHPERVTKDGCLARYASMGAILDTLAGVAYGSRQYLADHQDVGVRETEEFYRRYNQGDPEVRQLVQQSFEAIALAMRNLLILFRVDQFVLKGWPPNMVNDGIAWMQAILYSYPYELQYRSAPKNIRSVSLGQIQEVAGAAIAAIEHSLTNKRLARLATHLHNEKKALATMAGDLK